MLDWVHQWDDFEMYMYVRNDAEEQGIFMQVTKHEMHEGAEEWNIIYDRKIADLLEGTGGVPGSEDWEEAMLKTFLNEHPNLVNDEKEYLGDFLESNK